jgi:hypothetical protein
MKPIKQFIKYTFIFYAIMAFIYWVFIRPQNNNWGATPTEISAKMLEDDSISPNRVVSTRAINIEASKENVWTFVAQTGQNRGGFNSYYGEQ